VFSTAKSNAHRHHRMISQTINNLAACDFPATRPQNIPGTVKLWESPRQSRGVSHWTNLSPIYGKVPNALV
jgi:hypothetical protein